jgi:lipopolysaccharide transport system permease protein
VPGIALPEEPLIVVEPGKPLVAVKLRDLWAYRELLYVLAARDIKVRYKQTLLGVTWVVMQPLLMTLIFTVFLGKLARVPSSGQLPYALLAYSGLVLWTFFAGAVSSASQSLLTNAHLITKVYFPRMIIPCANIGSRLIDLVISFSLLVGLMIYYRMHVTWSIILVPVFVLLLVLLALGFSMLTSAVNVRYRDVGLILPVLIQIWMFVSPIVYSTGLVPPGWRHVYALNPLVGIVENFRSALFGGPFDWTSLAISTVIVLVLLVISAYAFRSMEKNFADLI